MTDTNIPPPPYQLSHDQKKIQGSDLILSKIFIPDKEEERDGDDDSKDYNESENLHFFSASIQPRGARPLPPSPASAQSSRRPAAIISPVGPLTGKTEHENRHQATFSPPPPFTAVGPSLDGPPYEYLMYHVNAEPFPCSIPNRASFNPPPVRHGQQRSSSISSSYSPETSYPLIYHSQHLEPSRSSYFTPENSTTATRLRFDPSVAYATSSNASYDTPDSTAINVASLYNSAVSSYLPPASSANPHSRSSYIGTKRSRYSTCPENTVAFQSPYMPDFSASHLPSSQPGRPKSSSHVRWAGSEDEFTRDIYS